VTAVNQGEPATTAEQQRDSTVALQNAAKLGGSLMLTWGIALGVRLFMPRYLGPDQFGVLNFADAFTATVFVLLSLGVDTYIRKEVSVDPSTASTFFSGVTVLRLAGALVLFAGMQAFLVITDRPRETWALVHVYGGACLLMSLNLSFAALLHARGTVDGLSLLNIASKLVWGGGVLITIVAGLPLVGIPLALLASELLKTVVSARLVQRHLALSWKVDLLGAKVALVGSLPMFLNFAAHTIYNKLDVSILAVVAGDREVAWYGAASLVAGLAMMVTPMIGWVLMPLFARARARSDEEYTRVMRRSLELVLAIAFPTSLLLGLGAEPIIVLLYGNDFAPAAASLRVLSIIFVFTYVAILSANALILTGRAWTQAFISIAGLALNPFLNWLLLTRAAQLGDGGAGVGAAWAQVGTELGVTAAMTALVGRRAFDRRSVVMIVKTLVVCGVVIAIDLLALQGLHGLVRLAVDGVLYLLGVLLTRALDVKELVRFARGAMQRRKQPIDGAGDATAPAVTAQGTS
jgi:O-antigen/teichoic acid export membrane protein